MLSPLSRYRDCRVLVTGHTGFKGSWLCHWLLKLGAEVHGYALDPEPGALLFDQLRLSSRLAADQRADVCDAKCLSSLVHRVRPDIVFHLAAQPLVRQSYDEPVRTFGVNVMGTVHLMEALRQSGHQCAAVIVTTDKCYENREWLHPYREEDRMGGHDPYSASKGAAELAVSAWSRSFLGAPDTRLRLASARAGNVIGGGDWAADRIVPDAIRSVRRGGMLGVRNPSSTRPWQHVLEPLGGYLLLARRLFDAGETEAQALASAFNFGPAVQSNRSVSDLLGALARHTALRWSHDSGDREFHEAGRLHLAIEKAWHLLNWAPVWDFETTIRNVAEWYDAEFAGADMGRVTGEQIDRYMADSSKV